MLTTITAHYYMEKTACCLTMFYKPINAQEQQKYAVMSGDATCVQHCTKFELNITYHSRVRTTKIFH